MSKRRGLPETSRMRHDSHFVEQLCPGGRAAGRTPHSDSSPSRRIPISLAAPWGISRTSRGRSSTRASSSPSSCVPRGDGRFTIISGERRFRGPRSGGSREIRCVEMVVADNELLEIALVENFQRKDLSPFEEAEGYKALQERHGYTHKRIADAVGKSRVTITEALSISRLPDRVQEEVGAPTSDRGRSSWSWED